MDKSNRITIPIEIRELLQLKTGGKIYLMIDPEKSDVPKHILSKIGLNDKKVIPPPLNYGVMDNVVES